MTEFSLRLDFRAPDFARPVDELYRAGLDMAEWADRIGFREVSLSEHHGSPDNYLPSPLVMGAAIAARTERLKIRMSAMVLPLHDPIRVAEDVAVLDQLSRGRVELVFAGGYVPSEFAMFGKVLGDRGRLMDEYLDVLEQAWTGEPFEYRGDTVQVTPPSYQKPRPILCLGGSTRASAIRAAQRADDYNPTRIELFRLYLEECRKRGKWPCKLHIPGPIYLHVADDPEAIWPLIAPHALHETNAYADWQDQSAMRGPYRHMDSIDDLRASGRYQVLTPDETVELAHNLGEHGLLIFHPLMGGLDPEIGWRNLRAFEKKVLPRL